MPEEEMNIMNTKDFMEEELLADIGTINNAAAQIAQQSKPNPPIRQAAPVQKVENTPGPPIQTIQTQQDKIMNQYNQEKEKLYEHYEQLTKLAYSDKNGFIVRNFGMAQLVISVNNDFVRLNGLVILRALKVKCFSKTQEMHSDKKEGSASFTEEVAGYLYEVWGEMENGQLGLTSSYIPTSVISILDLKSGYDQPEEE